jgi:hypothetical protein
LTSDIKAIKTKNQGKSIADTPKCILDLPEIKPHRRRDLNAASCYIRTGFGKCSFRWEEGGDPVIMLIRHETYETVSELLTVPCSTSAILHISSMSGFWSYLEEGGK